MTVGEVGMTVGEVGMTDGEGQNDGEYDHTLGPVDARIQGDGSTAFSVAINSIK